MPLDCDEAIGIAEVRIVIRPALLLFLLNETPDFIVLNVFNRHADEPQDCPFLHVKDHANLLTR
jgi:hypothetical protein